jgi:hypothetical protein
MCPISPVTSIDQAAHRVPLTRYEIREVGAHHNQKRTYEVIDKHQADTVVSTYLTFAQAAIECSFLSLLHLKSMHATKRISAPSDI